MEKGNFKFVARKPSLHRIDESRHVLRLPASSLRWGYCAGMWAPPEINWYDFSHVRPKTESALTAAATDAAFLDGPVPCATSVLPHATRIRNVL